MIDRITARLAPMGIVLLLTIAACDTPMEPEAEVAPHPVADAQLGYDNGAVSKPFRARMFTRLAGLVPDPRCGDFPRLLNTQAGEGQATHLGRFSVVITFCVDVTDVLDDGMLTAGESLPYDNGFGTLTGANGDVLYIEISGAVLPSDHPDYNFEFHDPFHFTGGTGRFTGATGEGMTASFVDQSDDRTDHEWLGTLVLPGR
jgi:hypothetical protein